MRNLTPVEYRQVCKQIEQKRANIFGTALSTPASGNSLQIEAQPVVNNAAEQQHILKQKTLILNSPKLRDADTSGNKKNHLHYQFNGKP